MSDLEKGNLTEWLHEIKRINAEKGMMSDEDLNAMLAVELEMALLKVDRPSGKWKVINKTINTTLVACSECGKRFHIPNYCFKSERDRWKCCPICLADMRGEDNETD